MNLKNVRYLAISILAMTGAAIANNNWYANCEKSCSSCSTGTCEGESNTYEMRKSSEAALKDARLDGGVCTITEVDPYGAIVSQTTTGTGGSGGAGSSSTPASGPGITPINYKPSGLVFLGATPDYVKTQVIAGVKTPVQLPLKGSTRVYTELPDGFQAAEYPNSQMTEPDAQGVRSLKPNAQPSSITIRRNPDGGTTTTQGKLDIVHKQRHPQTGAWVTRTIRKSAPQGNNSWTTEFYLGDPTTSNSAPLQPYRKITIARTPHQDGTESTREITQDLNGATYVTTSDISATYAFYKHGDPVKLSETQNTGTASSLTTTWTYNKLAADQAAFNKPATMRRSDGQWANYTYQGSPVTGILLTKTVSGWLDNAAPDIASAPNEAANRVVIEIEAKNETGTFSREQKIQGVLVSKSWGERYKDNSGMLIEKSRVETGTATLTTVRTGYPNDVSIPEADRGRLKSIQHPDGTVELHTHALLGDNRLVTIDSGAGTLAGVTAGTRTISTYTKDDTLIKEITSDIASGVLLSTREAIAFDANDQVSRWAYDNDPDDYSETLNGCCGIDSTRTRDGVVTTYTRDGLKRPKTAISQGITLTYTYGKKSIGGTDFPSENVTATADGLTLDQGTTVSDQAGNVIQQISPDLNGDGNPEITTITRDFATRTTTTENPDRGTIISTDFSDGQSKSTTGTATAPACFNYDTHNVLGGGEVTATASTLTGPWNKTYQNLAGRTLKSTFDDGTIELALQTNTYDNLGRLFSSEDADNVTQLVAYNTKGEAYRRVIDLNQNGQIDNADRVTDTLQDVITDSPIGNAIRSRAIIYDLTNNPVTLSTSYQSPDGLTTRQETLGVANPATSTSASHTDRADGIWTDISTAPDGTKRVVQYSNWLVTSSSSLDTENSILETSSTGHDALRRPETQTNSRTATAVVTRTAYHPVNGQVLTITEDLTTGTDRATGFGYDSMGRRSSTTLPDASVTYTSYWPTGQEKASYGSQTNPTVKLYTAEGQLHKLRTFRSTNLALAPDETTTADDETTWTYNLRNQLERKQYADGKGTDYTYTDAGRLKTRRWQRGHWTRYDCDTAGSLKATLYFTPATTETAMLAAATGNDPATPDVIVLNDKLGRKESVTTALAKAEFIYDPATFAIDTETISYNLDNAPGYEFSRVLDRKPTSLGRDTGWQLIKDGPSIENEATYGYGSTDGRLRTVSNPQISNFTFTYDYLPKSHLIEKVSGPIHDVVNLWEDTRDVLDTKTNKLAITVISKYDYFVNEIGQRKTVATSGSEFLAMPNWLWDYDSLGQVTSADHSGDPASDRGYLYDSIGNRRGIRTGAVGVPTATDGTITPAAGTLQYATNNLNQYSAISIPEGGTGVSPDYDDDGNAEHYPLPVSPTTNSTLVWDAENRKIEVKNSTGTTIEKNVFDSGSRKIATTANGVTTVYLYEGFNCIAEYEFNIQNSSFNIAKTRLWGTDLSGTLQGAGGVGGLLSESHISKPQSPIFYPTYDGNGNVSEYLKADGDVSVHFEYDPFGNTVVNTDTSNQFAYRFSTKPLDFVTGFYYYQYRYYDPLTGRWQSRDPIEERGGLNLYGFVGNDGVNRMDLFGREPIVRNEIVGTGSDFAEILEIALTEHEEAVDKGEYPDGYPDDQGLFYGMDLVQASKAWKDLANTKCTCKVYVVCSPLGLRKGESPFDWKASGGKSRIARGAFGAKARHCFLLLADDCDKDGNAVTQVLNLGAKTKSDYEKAATVFSEFRKAGEGCDVCDKVKEAAKNYTVPPYKASGPNSNTFVRKVLDAANITNPFSGGGSVPAGWNF